METICVSQDVVKDTKSKKGGYGLNYDEQAKLAAEEFAKKRTQRLLQVREQEKQFARSNRQAYEERLAQHRKKLYLELLQKWDKQHQQELQSLQDAHQRALHAASAAQEEAEEAAEAARRAEVAADARSAIQADQAAKRFAEAAHHARMERDILARERDRRVAWLQQARSAEKARAMEQVVKQQEAQRRAAEEARERLRRRGRDAEYDFRFTRFHETGLEQPPAPDLPDGAPSAADSAELAARKAAREEERQQAAEERGRAALHRLRMERAAKQLTAQLDSELQFRRSAAASATAASSPLAALQPHRDPDERRCQVAANRGYEPQQLGTYLDMSVPQPRVAPDFSALPRATWLQPTPWPAEAQSHHQPREPVAQTAVSRVGEGIQERARRADKTTQCCVDRQTQTESPEPRRQPACRVPRPHSLTQRQLSAHSALPAAAHSAPAAATERSLAPAQPAAAAHYQLRQEATPPLNADLAQCAAEAAAASAQRASEGSRSARPMIAPAAHKTRSILASPNLPAATGQQGHAGTQNSADLREAQQPMLPPAGDMVRTLPGELSDSCCSSRAGSEAGFPLDPPLHHIPVDKGLAGNPPLQALPPEHPRTAAVNGPGPDLQWMRDSGDNAEWVEARVGQVPDQALERDGAAERGASALADASCTISVAGMGGGTGDFGRVPADKGAAGAEKGSDGPRHGKGRDDESARLARLEDLLEQPHGADISGAFLAQAAAELEALCVDSLDNAPGDLPPSKPPMRMHPPHNHAARTAAPKVSRMFQPPGRPAKTALQRAEELLARLTQDAGLWETPACSTQPQKPSSNETAPGHAEGSMHFEKDDEQRLMLELEAISRQSGYILPCCDKAPSPVSKKGGATNSLELLAERLQDAISDTVSMTEGMLGHPNTYPNASVCAPTISTATTLLATDNASGCAPDNVQVSKGGDWDLPAPSSLAGASGVPKKGHLGSRGSVASSSCSSLLGALRLASIAEERLPNKNPALDADGGDIFSCSDDDVASDASGLPFDVLSLVTTEPGSPSAGGKDNGWLSDIESLDPDNDQDDINA